MSIASYMIRGTIDTIYVYMHYNIYMSGLVYCNMVVRLGLQLIHLFHVLRLLPTNR